MTDNSANRLILFNVGLLFIFLAIPYDFYTQYVGAIFMSFLGLQCIYLSIFGGRKND